MSRTINYKEKYEKALKAITELLDKGDREGLTIVAYRKEFEEIFPELKESMDEKVRKELIEKVKETPACIGFNDKNAVLTWLEKVGKDNRFLESIKVGDIITKTSDGILINLGQYDKALEHSDKVEPKFKVGDWVVWDNKISCHIDNIYQGKESLMYTITDVHNMTRSYSVKGFDNNAHLWTIQDAKDGDVLAEASCIFIIQKLGNNTTAKTYYTLYDDGDFDDGSILYFDIDSTKPATKEQRDLLFQKVHETGYEWNDDKKELKR